MNRIRYLNMILTVLTVVLTVQLWTMWTMSPSGLATVEAAGIPDAGAQRQQMVDELKLLNKKVEVMAGLLSNGPIRVTLSEGEKKPEAPAAAPQQ